MKLKIFTIRFDVENMEFNSTEFDVFCKKHLIQKLRPQLIHVQEMPYWTIAIEYEETKTRQSKTIATKTKNESPLFKKLKVWRNEYAQKIGFPPYIIASNNQLEEIATTKPISKKELQMIKGFGAKKIDQFGNFIILIIKNDKQNG